jgi:hypothetical protein
VEWVTSRFLIIEKVLKKRRICGRLALILLLILLLNMCILGAGHRWGIENTTAENEGF